MPDTLENVLPAPGERRSWLAAVVPAALVIGIMGRTG